VDRNLVLAFALSFLVLSLWTLWTEDGKPKPGSPQEQVASEQATPGSEAQEAPRFPELPESAPAPPPVPPAPGSESAAAAAAPTDETGPARSIEITRPLYEAKLTSLGAAIESWQLTEYTDAVGAHILMIPEPSHLGPLATTPFLELGQGDLSRAVWQVEERNENSVAFLHSRDGVTLRKVYSFDPDGYSLRLHVEVVNGTSASISPRFLLDWPVEVRTDRDFHDQNLAILHEGSVTKQPVAALGHGGFFKSMIGRGTITEYPVLADNVDWIGAQTTYFLSAAFPDDPEHARARFVVVEPAKRGSVQVFFDPVELPPGQSLSREYRAYLGPKEADRLEALGNGAGASIDLGWSWVHPLTRLFSWLLQALHSVIPNYGIGIILLTVLVRAVTAPLTLRQMRSMERLRRVQPRMKEIQEKYKDDRQRQSEELMKLYRQEKVNPLGGCFPMLLQLPVFIGLFYALQSSIQLRHAPFVGWIRDLSAPDLLFTIPVLALPVRVLPIVMGATMFVQQKLTPMQTPDPTQARMMMIVMPIMMTVLFYGFPSGLVLYWMLSNVLAIAHQLWIGRNMGPPGGVIETAKA
jgi:YidC/Oxa1 family membrane protein insertase